jgi:hypothetical protein
MTDLPASPSRILYGRCQRGEALSDLKPDSLIHRINQTLLKNPQPHSRINTDSAEELFRVKNELRKHHQNTFARNPNRF